MERKLGQCHNLLIEVKSGSGQLTTPVGLGEATNLGGRPRWQWIAMAALGVLALFILQLLVISMVMAPRQDLAYPLDDVEPLWEEHEDSVRRLEEKLVLLQNQVEVSLNEVALLESRVAARDRVMDEKLEEIENIVLAFGKKVERDDYAQVTNDNMGDFTDRLKVLEKRMGVVEEKKLSEEGVQTWKDMEPSMVNKVEKLVREVAMDSVVNHIRSEVETRISDHMERLVSETTDLRGEIKTVALDLLNEKLLEQVEEVRSIDKKEKEEMMNRIQRVEEMAAVSQDDEASSGMTEGFLKDWASEEVGKRLQLNGSGSTKVLTRKN